MRSLPELGVPQVRMKKRGTFVSSLINLFQSKVDLLFLSCGVCGAQSFTHAELSFAFEGSGTLYYYYVGVIDKLQDH